MTLIACLIAVALDRLVLSLQEWRRFEWFAAWARALTGRIRLPGVLSGHGEVLLLLLPPLALVGVVQWYAAGYWIGIPGLVFATAVLFLCLGPHDLAHQVNALARALEEGDADTARRVRGELFDGFATEEASHFEEEKGVTAIVIHANDRLFAVLLWFALLGPLGAALYRLASLLGRAPRDQIGPEVRHAALRLRWILDWIPAHLTALSYALVGSFEGAWHGWRRHAEVRHGPSLDSHERLLALTGKGALYLLTSAGLVRPVATRAEGHGADELRSALSMVWRTLAVWLATLALLTLAGWMG